MNIDIANKKIVYRFKTKPARSGNQYHFNIPSFAIKNKYINPQKEYWIYFGENNPKHDKEVINNEKLQEFLEVLKGLLPFTAIPAKAGSQYRITIPSFLIENKYFDPNKDIIYWIYFVQEKD